MPKKSKKQYSYPILKRKEIIKCMKELGIIINDIDLKQPKEEKCKNIYSLILEKLMGINVLSSTIPHNKLSIFRYPSLHESSIMNIRLIREVTKFMQKVGVNDFSISDLISPEPLRTIRHLSAIINFARWREHKNQIYLQEKVTIVSLDKKLKEIISENKKSADEFVEMNKKIEMEKPQVLILQNELKELHKNMELQHDKMEKKGEIAHNIKKELKKLKTIDMEKKTILNNNLDIICNLQSKIVKSPQRIKKELKILSNKIENEKINIAKNNEKLKYDTNKYQQLLILNQLINKRMNEMKEINILKNDNYLKLEQDIKKIQHQKTSLEKELKSIIKQHKTGNIKLNNKKHQYSVFKQESNTKKNQIEIKNKQIELLKKENSKQSLEKQRKIANLEKQIESKKESINHLLKKHKNNINQINIKYKQLLQVLTVYHKKMNQGLDQW